jgi:SAM-dependent methyltransferase
MHMKVGPPSRKTNYDWISLLRSYQTYVAPSSRVLEIGASTIERSKELSSCCRELIGLELLPERTPQDFDNVKYLTGDWQDLSQIIEPESIDIAISSHVIEHVPDDLKAINELYKILKPDGMSILITPNRRRITRAIVEIFTGPREFPWWEHLREYIEDDLLRLLDASLFTDYKILPVVFGLHGGPVFIYAERVPDVLRRFANFWEIHLFKTLVEDNHV